MNRPLSLSRGCKRARPDERGEDACEREQRESDPEISILSRLDTRSKAISIDRVGKQCADGEQAAGRSRIANYPAGVITLTAK